MREKIGMIVYDFKGEVLLIQSPYELNLTNQFLV
jgi:hypothetical protein